MQLKNMKPELNFVSLSWDLDENEMQFYCYDAVLCSFWPFQPSTWTILLYLNIQTW